jgi:hypothetical protein
LLQAPDLNLRLISWRRDAAGENAIAIKTGVRAALRARHSKGTSLLTADFSNAIVAAARPRLIEARMTILDRLRAPRLPRLSVTLLTLLVIVPVTLAHASPPDQTWLAGIYDQADFDDVVGLLTSALDATDSAAAPEAGACFALAPMLSVATVAGPSSAPAYSPPLRAPPIA